MVHGDARAGRDRRARRPAAPGLATGRWSSCSPWSAAAVLTVVAIAPKPRVRLGRLADALELAGTDRPAAARGRHRGHHRPDPLLTHATTAPSTDAEVDVASKKDLVEGQAFSRRRLITAFVSGAPADARSNRASRCAPSSAVSCSRPSSWSARSPPGLLAPTLPDGWDKDSLVIAKDTRRAVRGARRHALPGHQHRQRPTARSRRGSRSCRPTADKLTENKRGPTRGHHRRTRRAAHRVLADPARGWTVVHEPAAGARHHASAAARSPRRRPTGPCRQRRPAHARLHGRQRLPVPDRPRPTAMPPEAGAALDTAPDHEHPPRPGSTCSHPAPSRAAHGAERRADGHRRGRKACRPVAPVGTVMLDAATQTGPTCCSTAGTDHPAVAPFAYALYRSAPGRQSVTVGLTTARSASLAWPGGPRCARAVADARAQP